MPITYLGIDASIQSTGIVLLRMESKPVEILLKPPKKKSHLPWIYSQLVGLIKLYAPTLAALEGASYGSLGLVFDLGEVYGISKLALELNSVPYILPSPKEVKKFGSGSGSATKLAMIAAAQKEGCVSAQNDICDAWHLARLARSVHEGTSVKATRASEEVVSNMLSKVVLPCL